jgi:DNA polymerase (family 10)
LNVLQGLDRAEVEPLVVKILKLIEPWCVRSEVAGSFRRGKAVINDLDIVVEPKPLPGSWLQIVKAVRTYFNCVTEKQGDKLATLYLPFARKKIAKFDEKPLRLGGYIQVDLYRADAKTWGVLLLVRTGSKEHNVKLCDLAISKGLRLQYSVGLTDQAGCVVAGRTEEEVFSALGLGYIEPNDREVLT